MEGVSTVPQRRYVPGMSTEGPMTGRLLSLNQREQKGEWRGMRSEGCGVGSDHGGPVGL